MIGAQSFRATLCASVACAVAILPAVALAQPAAYLKGATLPADSPTGISGHWNQTAYMSSGDYPPRARVMKTDKGTNPPLLPWAAQLLEKRLTDSDHDKPFANTASLCLPQGVPYMMHSAVGGPMEILETPGQVTFINDAYNEMWFVYLDAKHPAKDDVEPTYHGDSVGHWEGDTLVIDSIGFNNITTLDQVGTPHSTDMHVITRVRRNGPDTIEFRVTIDDPKTFSSTWNEKPVVFKRAPKGARISEVVCNENDRNLPTADGTQSLGFSPSPLHNAPDSGK